MADERSNKSYYVYYYHKFYYIKLIQIHDTQISADKFDLLWPIFYGVPF